VRWRVAKYSPDLKAAVREADGVGFDDVAAGSDVSPTQMEQPTSELYRFTVMG
jgi:hypothetical protein